MRKAGGYAITVDPDHGTTEQDTFTCNHCNAIVFVKPKQDPSEMGGFCRMCMKHICQTCTGKHGCKPFEKRMEEMERKDRLYQAARRG